MLFLSFGDAFDLLGSEGRQIFGDDLVSMNEGMHCPLSTYLRHTLSNFGMDM